MVRVSPSQASLSSGEISPQLYGRPDFSRHQSGVELCRGFVPIAEGGALRLPGTRKVGEIRDGAKSVWALPAVLFEGDSYMLEFTDRYVRIWRDQDLVESGGYTYIVRAVGDGDLGAFSAQIVATPASGVAAPVITAPIPDQEDPAGAGVSAPVIVSQIPDQEDALP